MLLPTASADLWLSQYLSDSSSGVRSCNWNPMTMIQAVMTRSKTVRNHIDGLSAAKASGKKVMMSALRSSRPRRLSGGKVVPAPACLASSASSSSVELFTCLRRSFQCSHSLPPEGAAGCALFVSEDGRCECSAELCLLDTPSPSPLTLLLSAAVPTALGGASS
ncbi:hypothetical protein K437DRAFT_130658 [Tilletiaria anomala UBC 951]|uniref:Uncharacterized protein n=1 Tax=Tilletiaria anomala (strain ATCC 24038 / CBS 436.72 / UBC 951) TaxID=1037660 RepID=A0A066W0U4_TILAU|nr:uncharacterized protein K437DRAFT_130658 [Tilletiaria anomala UBC 951]KDN44694.1 hypothetical protein K437DRAFT_130658 [Tilletiaria anomala UBC 951]